MGGQATVKRCEIGNDLELDCLLGLINVHIRPTLGQAVDRLLTTVESVAEVSISFSGCRDGWTLVM